MVEELIKEALESCKERFYELDKIALSNQRKVQKAFANNKVALMHFNGTTGYGYDDVGRDTLNNVFAEVFGTESGIASPLIASGTHAITLALFGVLRHGDEVLAVSGEPYDTIQGVIYGKNNGSLADFGVKFDSIGLKNGDFDYENIEKYVKSHANIKMIYVQRSRGYENRNALSVAQIGRLCEFVHGLNANLCVFCDNCYGEFVETSEPTDVGVDLMAGSLIKNAGGGLAPTGGYVVGKAKYVDLVAGRLTVPSMGTEIGSYTGGYRLFYQGLFNAPHAVNQALKTATAFVFALNKLGYKTIPSVNDQMHDIVCSIELGSPEKLVAFCRSVQSASPVDAFVSPEPWDMPGYDDQVVMAAGCFVQGASLELSADGPMREPFVAYMQGGLTLEHGLLALENVLKALTK